MQTKRARPSVTAARRAVAKTETEATEASLASTVSAVAHAAAIEIGTAVDTRAAAMIVTVTARRATNETENVIVIVIVSATRTVGVNVILAGADRGAGRAADQQIDVGAVAAGATASLARRRQTAAQQLLSQLQRPRSLLRWSCGRTQASVCLKHSRSWPC